MKISNLLRYSVMGLGMLLVIALILCTERPETMNEFPAPSWHEITPGQTTERELILQLGRPDKVFWGDLSGAHDWIDVLAQLHNRLCGGSVYYYRESDVLVYVRSGKIWAIKASILAFGKNLYLKEFIDSYGKPARVAWSKEDPLDRVIVFPEKGILIHVRADPDINRAGIGEVLYFQPMSLGAVLAVFRNELATVDDPFPQLPTSDIIRGDMDPWGFNVRE